MSEESYHEKGGVEGEQPQPRVGETTPQHVDIAEARPADIQLAELNQAVPVDKLLTPEAAEDAKKLTGSALISIFRNSPMNNAESEILLGKIAVAAVVEGRWVDVPKQSRSEKLLEQGFVTEVEGEDGSAMLRPTETLARFVQARFKPWAPKEQATA